MKIEPLLKANECLKEITKLVNLDLEIGKKEREILRKEISELMKMVRKIDKYVLCLSKEEIYITGKIMGRLEALYALIAKKIVESEKKEME